VNCLPPLPKAAWPTTCLAARAYYGLEKKHIIYEKLSTQNFTSDFNRRRPFAQILLSQNSKAKYESRKILDFARKMRKKNDF
jgi:hypothetical protein